MYRKVNQLYIYIYPHFLHSFPILHYRVLSSLQSTEPLQSIEFPVLYSRSLLVIYIIYSSVYMSDPIYQFIPHAPPSPLVTISLFSTFVTLFLLTLYCVTGKHKYAFVILLVLLSIFPGIYWPFETFCWSLSWPYTSTNCLLFFLMKLNLTVLFSTV